MFNRFAADLTDVIATIGDGAAPTKMGVAVSGGGDSMALLLLLRDWAKTVNCQLSVVTVDHGLRKDAAAEAAMVARITREFGLSHDTLKWTGWDGAGNLQAEARSARVRLISEWAKARGIDVVALGHTADDQAETVLMRLARGSGVDGLAGMSAARMREDTTWIRPILRLRRGDLRGYLEAQNTQWIDDPSNEDTRFDRVKARQAMQALAPLGINVARLQATADIMAQARDVLRNAAGDLAVDAATQHGGDIVFDTAKLAGAARETRFRVLSGALRFVGSHIYRPRLAQLEDAWAAIITGTPRQLHGCHILPKGGQIRICREWQAVRDMAVPGGDVWDTRWRVFRPGSVENSADTQIRALGENGIRMCDQWRETGFARASIASSPAIWHGDVLLAAPMAGFGHEYSAKLVLGRENFVQFLMMH